MPEREFGIVRTIKNGRISLPSELLQILALAGDDYVEIRGIMYNGYPSIIITKYNFGCFNCHRPLLVGESIELNNHMYCLECAKAIRDKLNGLERIMREGDDNA